jgi:hypothetical protein
LHFIKRQHCSTKTNLQILRYKHTINSFQFHQKINNNFII